MSTPYKLAEAFELLRQQQQKPRGDTVSTNAVDILGIVSNVSNSKRLSDQSRVRKCQIWLLDESLDTRSRSNGGALGGSRFVLYESSEIARTVKENIKVGDILRFNRVTLKSYRGSLQFQFSSLDPEPGLSWFRLGSVDDHAIGSENGCNGASKIPIPKSMITCKERIADLVGWYKNYKGKSMNPPSAPRALPTRKRTLDELQSSVGLLSHIKVCVKFVRFASTATETNTNYGLGQRSNKRQLPPTAFASFVDDSGAAMSFIDSSGRFLEELKSAEKNCHTTRLVMTNISTDHQSNLRGSTTSNEIVLIPTETTTARLVSGEKMLNHVDTRKSTYGFGTTQTQEKEHAIYVVVRSSIADICVNGLSLKTTPSIFSSTSEYLETLTGKDGKFENVIIYLERNDEQAGNDGLQAAPGVLKTLCGSLDIAELSNDETLCMHSMNLLRDFLHEDVILEWSLKKDECNENFKIVKATIHRVPN